MANIWQSFRELLPRRPLLVGTVVSHNADGTSTLSTPEGGSVRVQGQDVAINDQAFYQDGRIVGEAPSLAVTVVDV